MAQKYKIKIHGMHCASCVVLVEQKALGLPGVTGATVSLKDGWGEIISEKEPDIKKLNEAIAPYGYTATLESQSAKKKVKTVKIGPPAKTNYTELSMIFLLVVAMYFILKNLDLIPDKFGVTSNMSLWAVFVIGLVAAVSSCIAVTGGLLLGVSERYAEAHPDFNAAQKFRPHIYFNIGRIISYTAFGAAIGALGSAFKFSETITGFITVVASLAMVLMALQLLHLFPRLTAMNFRMPKFIGHKVFGLGQSDHKAAPFLLGAATFFLPCGFTQALQLYVLSKGDAKLGALTMLVFSLGTLPALLSLGVVTSLAKGGFQRFFLKLSAVVILLFGLSNVLNGLNLAGVSITFGSSSAVAQNNLPPGAVAAQRVGNKQIVKMAINRYAYTPSVFAVKKGMPVEWQIDASGAAGCASVITARSIGITQILSRSQPTVITFTPQQSGDIAFSCPMGMTTRGAKFIVQD